MAERGVFDDFLPAAERNLSLYHIDNAFFNNIVAASGFLAPALSMAGFTVRINIVGTSSTIHTIKINSTNYTYRNCRNLKIEHPYFPK